MAIQARYADESDQAAKNRGGREGGKPDRKLAKALQERHPFYDEKHEEWVKLLDLHEGSSKQLGKYIHRHARESRPSHEQRAKRIVNRNFISAVTSLYSHFIFSKTVMRSPIPKQLQDEAQKLADQGFDPEQVKLLTSPFNVEWERQFLNDVDRCGTPIDRFMRDLSEYIFLFGKMYVLIDLPRLGPEFNPRKMTESDRQELGYRPYCEVYNPLQVTNWALDRDGKPLWIRFLELPDVDVGPFATREEKAKRTMKDFYSKAPPKSDNASAANRKAVQYRTFDKQNWYVHQVIGDQVVEIDRGYHGLGEVPVVSFYSKRGLRYPFGGQSAVQDIALLQQGILNLDSLIDESVYQQAISILVMGRQPVQGEEIVISESNVLEVSPTSFAPYFLTPSQAPLQFMEQRVQIFEQDVMRLSKFGGGFGMEPKAVSPGTAAYEFNLTNRTLADMAEYLESGEKEIHRLWFKYYSMGASRPAEFRGYIEYSDDFSVQSWQEDLTNLQSAKQAIRSPTFKRELEKKVAKKILASQDEELTDRIEDEIDVVPEITPTFTGYIYDEPLLQESSNPAMGDAPIGHLKQLLEQLGLDEALIRPNSFLKAQQQIAQQTLQMQGQEQQLQQNEQAAKEGKGDQGKGQKKGDAKKSGGSEKKRQR